MDDKRRRLASVSLTLGPRGESANENMDGGADIGADPSLQDEVSSGLSRVLSDVPTNNAYAEIGTGVTARGPEGWVEGGYHPLDNLGLFGRGFISAHEYGAMVGAMWKF